MTVHKTNIHKTLHTPYKILDDLSGGDIPLSNLLKWYDNHEELISGIIHLCKDNNVDVFRIQGTIKTKMNIWELENIVRQTSTKMIPVEMVKDILISITENGTSLVS